uniref:3-beta hydroxysteroid dehydrogenase/isomerase domain-containing protein n=1 Tax=Oryza brachyantha TaxID=4533 RepID=J3M1P8_ORYBR
MALLAAPYRKSLHVPIDSRYMLEAWKPIYANLYDLKLQEDDDMANNSHLKGLEALGPFKVIRADLGEEGSFDEAVNGCDYSFLVAAPLNIQSENPEKEMIEAGVQGTLNVMRSCVKAGTVKRVIITSSSSAISRRPLQGDGDALDEDSWSDVEYLAREKPPSWVTYELSGVWSLQGAFREGSMQIRGGERHQPDHRDPGDHLGCGTDADDQHKRPNYAVLDIRFASNEVKLNNLKALVATGSWSIVHVDDLCRAEIFLAEKESASGSLEEFPGKAKVCYSSEKLMREGFEFKFTNVEEIFDELIEYGKAIGILPH